MSRSFTLNKSEIHELGKDSKREGEKNKLRDIFLSLDQHLSKRSGTGISTALAAVNGAARDFFSAGDKSSFECSAHGISNIT